MVAGSFFSLGFNSDQNVNFDGGQIVIEFIDNFLIDGPGNDLKMWEVTGGSSYPVEKIKIEVSQDNSNWFVVESSLDRDAEADLANSGLAWARYVRLTDVSDRNEFNAAADGYDLDGFSALTCADRTTAATVQAAAVLALADFKNPFNTATAAVSTTGTTIGFVNVTDDGSDVTVATCFAEIGTPTAACNATDATSTLSNTIAIE